MLILFPIFRFIHIYVSPIVIWFNLVHDPSTQTPPTHLPTIILTQDYSILMYILLTNYTTTIIQTTVL